jgi:malonate transporter and related proteins
MLDTILGALLPMVVTFLLGFVAAWRRDFGPKDAAILNRMVLHYAVPLLLFVGTVSTPRAELSQDIPLLIALGVAIVGLYGVVLLLSRFAFRRRMSASALAALTASAPAVPFSAVLGHLFGGPIAIPIAITSLVINLTVLPVTILLLTLDTAGEDSQGKSPAKDGEHSASPPAPAGSVLHGSALAAKLAETVKEPIVWAPVLAFVIVLSGAGIPQLIVHSLSVLGSATGGVALFASGIVLASGTIKVNRYVLFLVFLKNIVQPALVLGGLRWLGYGNPIVSGAVLMTAIPAMPMVIMLAVQYRALEAEAASAVFLSVIGSVVTMGAFIALTG